MFRFERDFDHVTVDEDLVRVLALVHPRLGATSTNPGTRVSELIRAIAMTEIRNESNANDTASKEDDR